MRSLPNSLFIILLAALFLLTFAVAAIAGTTGIISGVVTDNDTGAKLSGVNIVVKGTSLTTVTDAHGYFVITNVPPGSYVVTASLVGYGEVSRTDVQVMMDATSATDVDLAKVEIDAPDAVVTAIRSLVQPDMAPTLYMVPARQEKMVKNQPSNLYQIPGIVGAQPGIVVDSSDAPHIRGGREDEIGYMLEGFPIREPLTNSFGTNAVTIGMSKMQVYTGGYRAEYGNAISGVFNEIKKTGSEAPGGSMEMTGGDQNYNGSYIEYGGVAPSGLDYYVGSYLWKTNFERKIMSPGINIDGTESADTIGKFVFPSGNDKYTLLLNQGTARYYLNTVHDYTYHNAPVPEEADHGHQGYGLFGLTWSHNFSNSSFLTVRPYQFTTKSLNDMQFRYQDYGTRQHGLQLEYTNQLNENHLMKAGASTTRSKNRFLAWFPGYGDPMGWGDLEYTSNVTTTQSGLFIQDQAKLSDRWRAEFGMRYDTMKFDKQQNADTDESQISPRVGLTYSVDSRNVIKSSWGRFIQFPLVYVMDQVYTNPDWAQWRLGNPNLKPERSTSWDISWERQLDDVTLARVTPFYRSYTDLIQSTEANPGDPMSPTVYGNAGSGKSTGVELYASRKLKNNWEGWLSYTWMRARANASTFSAQIDPSVWSYVDWDQRHTLNLVLAHRTKTWEHNWQLFYGSGLADTVYGDFAQRSGDDAAVISWNITRKLPEGSRIGDSIFLNVWNVFNTGKATHYLVYPDGSREANGWIAPRFITMGILRKF